MRPEVLESLKEVLNRIHANSVYAFNRAKALEILLKRRPDLWKEYQDALHEVQTQDVHQDFGSLLDKIQ
jgi:tRNA G37 N-methylase TrmD